MTDTSERLVFATSRFGMAATAVVLFLTMLLGVWFVGVADDGIMIFWSWLAIILVGLGTMAAAWQVFTPSRLELTPEGFRITGLIGVGLIPWRDVEAFFVHSEAPEPGGHAGVQPHAAWRLSDVASARDTVLSRINRAGLEGEVDGTVPRNLGASPQEMVDLLESWRVRYS